MKIQTIDNIELHYSAFGDKNNTPVVLIHGLGAERNMWKPQLESLPKEGLFLIAPDMRGHGKTSKVNTFRIKDCARDISELLNHLGFSQVVIAGVSMGGVIARQFACDFPNQPGRVGHQPPPLLLQLGRCLFTPSGRGCAGPSFYRFRVQKNGWADCPGKSGKN